MTHYLLKKMYIFNLIGVKFYGINMTATYFRQIQIALGVLDMRRWVLPVVVVYCNNAVLHKGFCNRCV